MKRRHQFLLLVIITFLLFSCFQKPEERTWKFIGFENRITGKLVLQDSCLYVCADLDGLWKKNIKESNSQWQYMGFNDTTSTNSYYGVKDIVVYPEDDRKLLITYNPYPDSKYTNSTYITTDGGESWTPADSGLEYYYNGNTYHSTISQLIYYPDHILGIGRGGAFIKEDFNTPWSNELISPNVGAFNCVLECHQAINNIVWMGGEGSLSQPILAFSTDGGFGWKIFNINDLGYSEIDIASVNGIAFNPEDTNTVYIGLSDKIIMTVNCGNTWSTPCDSCPGSNGLIIDPIDENHLWSIGWTSFSETYNSCKSWHEIEMPFQSTIWDIILDEETRVLYLGTENGIYSYNP